jgi:hypothetical protein
MSKLKVSNCEFCAWQKILFSNKTKENKIRLRFSSKNLSNLIHFVDLAWTKVKEMNPRFNIVLKRRRPFFLPTLQLEEIFNEILHFADSSPEFYDFLWNLAIYYSL